MEQFRDKGGFDLRPGDFVVYAVRNSTKAKLIYARVTGLVLNRDNIPVIKVRSARKSYWNDKYTYYNTCLFNNETIVKVSNVPENIKEVLK